MEAENVLEVIKKLIGETSPTGSTHLDDKRLENLTEFLEVFDEMHTMIDNITYNYKDDSRHSVKQMVKLCNDKLVSMGLPIDD